MQILVDLVKIGAIGASLAFLYLSYTLLKGESELRDANKNPAAPRPEILNHIRKFRTSALIFLIVGVTSEFVLTNSVDIVRYWLQSELVRVRFDDWEFIPEKKTIAFGLAEAHVNTGFYVLPSQQAKIDVYVGVRKKSSIPYDRGKYDLLFGPYSISTLSRQEIELNEQQLERLGRQCIEFTAFGVPKGSISDIKAPFSATGAVAAFHTAYACVGS